MSCAAFSTSAWTEDRCGFGLHITLRFTSPQAAIVSIAAWLISAIVRLRLVLMIPWNWKAWRVVSLIVPLANWVASRSVSIHCRDDATPPGTRIRIMKE